MSDKDPAAEAIIRRALEEEAKEKQARKSSKDKDGGAHKAARKGKTLEQLEAEEGGAIKESLVGMAQTKRAARRKGRAPGDTDLVDDVRGVEEDLLQEEEGGVKLEAFNLKEERQRGHFDDAGNYVEKEGDDEDKDAWLDSEEAKVVDAKTLQRIQEQQARMAASEAAAPPTAAQLARLQWQVAQLLEPGETVARGLKRLGGHSRRPAKRARRGAGGEAAAAAPQADQPALDPGVKERFERLTEASSALMDAGEGDVYSRDRSYFERAAAVYLDLEDEEGAGPSTLMAGGASKAAYEEADEDMFGDDGGGGAAPAAAPAAGAGAAAPQEREAEPARPREAEDATDYGIWPVKELRRFLTERGQDAAGIVEKAELVAKVKAAAAAGAAAAVQAPAGYAYDPSTKLYKSAGSGMFWDAGSGGFYNPIDGKWYSYSWGGGWVEWPPAAAAAAAARL